MRAAAACQPLTSDRMPDRQTPPFYSLALSLAGALVALAGPAGAECSADWLAIQSKEDAGIVELYAVNTREIPISVTMQVWTEHMTADRATTFTETVAPGATRLVMTLRKIDQEGDSRYGYRCEWSVGSIDATHDDDLLYRLPYESGKSFRVLQGYGSRLSHTGPEEFTVDFQMAEGTPVHAARAGVVARIEESNSRGCWKGGCGKYANYIVILHDDWTTGEYYHLQQDGVLVDVGDRVVAGQKIGLSGNTGNSALPHLHFGVYRAAPWGKFQSVPVQFSSVDGVVRKPRRGGLYQAVSIESTARSKAETDGSNSTLN